MLDATRFHISNKRAGFAVTLFMPDDLAVIYEGHDGEYKDLTALACSLLTRGINTRVVEEITGGDNHRDSDCLIGGIALTVDSAVSDRNVDDAADEVVALVASLVHDQVEKLGACEVVALIADGVRDAMLNASAETAAE